MTEQSHTATASYTAEDDLSLSQILKSAFQASRYLLRNWVRIAIAALICAIIGFLVANYSSVKYLGRMSFVLEEGKASAGGLSAIAGQLGFDFGGSSSGNLLAGDNIIGLLRSRKFVKEALLTPFNENSVFSLADQYAEVYGYRKDWRGSGISNSQLFFNVDDSGGFTRTQDSLLRKIEDNILRSELRVDRSDKKMSFFEVSVGTRDEKLSKLLTERVVNGAVNFYIETKTRRMRSNVDRLQRRADSIGGLLNSRTFAAAAAQSRLLDMNPAYQTAGVAAELSGRDKMMIGTIYAELVKNLEIQKATLTQETPVIQVVDSISFPLIKEKKSRLKYALIGGLLGASLLAVILIFRRQFTETPGKR